MNETDNNIEMTRKPSKSLLHSSIATISMSLENIALMSSSTMQSMFKSSSSSLGTSMLKKKGLVNEPSMMDVTMYSEKVNPNTLTDSVEEVSRFNNSIDSNSNLRFNSSALMVEIGTLFQEKEMKAKECEEKEESKRKYVDIVTDKDVLRGRGNGANLHPGNVSFRTYVTTFQDRYRNAATGREEKSCVVKNILDWVQYKQGGRFLQKDEDDGQRWYIISNEEAEKKIRQVLREN